VASLAGVGRWGSGWWSFLDQEPGLRAQERGAMPPAAPARRAASLRGTGGHWQGCGVACGPGPDPSSHRRPEGNQPGLVVSSRITRCCGAASSGWTPPARADWLRPPTRRGIRDLPPVGIGHRPGTTPTIVAAAGISPGRTRRSSADPAAAGVSAPMRGRCLTPRTEVGSGSLVASAQTAAHDGPTVSSPCHTKPPPDQPYRSRHGLYSGGPAWYPQPQRRDEGSGPDHKQRRSRSVSPSPSERGRSPRRRRRRHRAPLLGAMAWLLI